MKVYPITTLCLLLALAGLPGSAHAILPTEGLPHLTLSVPPAPPVQPSSQQQSALEKLRQDAGSRLLFRWDSQTGNPALISGLRIATGSHNPEQAARQALDRLSGVFAGRQEDLRLSRTHRHRGLAFVTLQQYAGGLPVEGSSLVVSVTKDGVVRSLRGRLYPTEKGVGKAELNAAQAASQALSSFKKDWEAEVMRLIKRSPSSQGSLKTPQFKPFQAKYPQVLGTVAYPLRGRLVPAFEVRIEVISETATYVSFVDAQTGGIIERFNSRLNATVEGSILPWYPGFSPQALEPLAYLGVTDSQEMKFATDAQGEYGPPQPPVYSLLRGPWTFAVNAAGDQLGYSGAESWAWDFNWAVDDAFTGVNAFYHTNRYYDHVKNTLGINEMDFQMTVIYNVDFANASYEGRSINLGKTDTINFAHESTVVYHEFTHGIVDEISGLLVVEQSAALHEGLADYFAASFNDAPEIGTYAFGGSGPRRMDNEYVYPLDYIGESHNDGLIFCGGLWDLRSNYGAETVDNLMTNALYYFSSRTDFLQARDALLAADADYFQGAYREDIIDTFSARGIGGVRMVGFTIDDSVGGDGNGAADPSETIALYVRLLNQDTLFGQPFSGALTVGSACAQVSQDTSEWPTLGLNERGNNLTAFEITLDSGCQPGDELTPSLTVEDTNEKTFKIGLKLQVGKAHPFEVPRIGFTPDIYEGWPSNGDYVPDPGEFMIALPVIKNISSSIIEGVRVFTSVGGPGAFINGSFRSYYETGMFPAGTLSPGQEKGADYYNGEGTLFAVQSVLDQQTTLTLVVDVVDGEGNVWTTEKSVFVSGPDTTKPVVTGFGESFRWQYTYAPDENVPLELLIAEPGPMSLAEVLVSRAADGSLLTTIPVRDDGVSPDLTAGDSYYTGKFAPSEEGLFYLDYNLTDVSGNHVRNKKTVGFATSPFEVRHDTLVYFDSSILGSLDLNRVLAAHGVEADLYDRFFRGGTSINPDLFWNYTGQKTVSIGFDFEALFLLPELMRRGTSVLLADELITFLVQHVPDLGMLLGTYFHTEIGATTTKTKLVAPPNDPVSSGLEVTYRATFPESVVLNLQAPAVPVLQWFSGFGAGDPAATRVEETDGARKLFFPFDVSRFQTAASRDELMGRAIAWLQNMPSAEKPLIHLAGYWNMGSMNPATALTIQALTLSEGVDKMEIFLDGTPTGVELGDDGTGGDLAAGDGLFGFSVPLSGVPPVRLTLELVAGTATGSQSHAWPYLTVE